MLVRGDLLDDVGCFKNDSQNVNITQGNNTFEMVIIHFQKHIK